MEIRRWRNKEARKEQVEELKVEKVQKEKEKR
jgi:hypothetical protein